MNGKKIFATIVLVAIISTAFLAFNSNFAKAEIISSTPIELSADSATISCINLESPEINSQCNSLANQILAVTVRIELHTWVTFGGHQKPITTKSHATIMAGKYLVTHNHFKYSLTEQVEENGEVKGYTAVSLRKPDGNLLLDTAPLSSFSIVYEDAETLVLAFVNENGQGLFEAANLPSALFADFSAVNLTTGDELAQIDWDGETAHVDWVLVDNVSLNDEVPQMQVSNFPKKGCSGGGVFFNGIHVGNNWAKNIEENSATDEITRRYSIIALNSAALMDLVQ
jgi:hypothetical protein